MKLITTGNAGTMESNDIMITVEPSDAGGVQVELTSSVYQQFGKQIIAVIRETAADYGVENALITAVDKGALDCTARAAGIAALDTVFSNVNDEEGFIAEATLIKKLGFDGKSVINPRQIEPLHKVFMPSEKDLNKARAIMEAIAEANARGSGVASLNGKMIDKPVVTRAKRLLELYEAGSKADEVEEL